MATTSCTIDGCGMSTRSNGLCEKHYTRVRRYGDPHFVRFRVGDDLGRWRDKVDKNGPVPVAAPHLGPCWLWTGFRRTGGYGGFQVGGRSVGAHVWAYETFVGLVPADRELDHLCRVRHCVNPQHLEPVTHAENVRRGIPRNSQKTECIRGHPFDDVNTYWTPTGKRNCRICKAALELRHRREGRKAAA